MITIALAQIKQCQLDIIALITICIQFIQLCIFYFEESLKLYFYILLILWISTRVVSAIVSCIFNQKSFSCHYLKEVAQIILSYEIISLILILKPRSQYNLIGGFIGQIHLYAIPITLINQHIIATCGNIDNSLGNVLHFILIINLILLSLCNLLSVISHNKQEVTKLSIASLVQILSRAFAFWYILSQFLSYSFILIITWVVLHIFLGIGIASGVCNYDMRIKYFISYILQLDIVHLENFNESDIENKQNQQQIKVEAKKVMDWSDVIYNSMLQIYLLLFFTLKLIYNPIASQIDYVFYLIYSLTFPKLYRSVKLLYDRTQVIMAYNEIIQWRYGSLKMSDIILQLSKNLVNEGKIFINIEEVRTQINKLVALETSKCSLTNYQLPQKNMIWINQKQFMIDLNEIKRSLKSAGKGSFKSLQIHFYDESQNIQIILFIDETHTIYQKIVLKQGFDKDFASELFDFFQYLINPNHSISVEANDLDVINIRLPSLRFQTDCFAQNSQYKQLISGNISINYQALAFYKNLANLVPLNPSLILYDLFDYS